MAEIMQGGVEKKPGGGGRCCLFGCLGVVVVGIVVVIAGFFAARHMYGRLMEEYSQGEPLDLPEVGLADQRLAEVRREWQHFAETVQAGEAARIELTADEVNALIANHEDWKELRGHVYLNFDQGQVNGLVSMPLEDMIPGGAGCYLNGEATFDVSAQDGRLHIYLLSLNLAGKDVPDVMMQELKNQDLAREIYDDPSKQEAVEQLKRIKLLEFQPDRMIIEIEAAGDNAAAEQQ